MRLGGAQLHQAIGQPTALARLGSGSRASWTPNNLGTDLLAFWDAERAATFTLAGSLVTTWADAKNGYAPTQAISGFKPAYSATTFNGRPGVTFDGTDDYLSLESIPFPVGANACEMWVLAGQSALPADATTRTSFAYGGTVASTRRVLYRAVTSGVNRLRFDVGDGSSAVSLNLLTTDLSGNHLQRGVVSSAQIAVSADGGTELTGAVVPATGSTRTRIGGNTANTAAAFWQGPINAILVTNPLSAPNAALLLAYLKTRGGIA